MRDEAPTPFARALLSVITGAAPVEGFAERLLQGAVQEVLEKVARAHNLDAQALMREYGNSAVATWAHSHPEVTLADATRCSARARSGKQCSKTATHGSFCVWHHRAGASAPPEDTRRQTIAEFQASLDTMPRPPPRPAGPYGLSQQILTQEDDVVT
jgi:hypothetical protein